MRRLAELDGPWRCDVADALVTLKRTVLDVALWRWPFAEGVDYLVCGIAAR